MPSFLSQPDRKRIIASSYVRVMYAWSKITIFVACPWRKWQRRTKWSSIDLERTWAQRDSAEKHSKFRPSSTRSWTQGVWFLHVNRFNIEYYTFILVLSSNESDNWSSFALQPFMLTQDWVYVHIDHSAFLLRLSTVLGFALSLQPQHGHHHPSHLINNSQTAHLFCPAEYLPPPEPTDGLRALCRLHIPLHANYNHGL